MKLLPFLVGKKFKLNLLKLSDFEAGCSKCRIYRNEENIEICKRICWGLNRGYGNEFVVKSYRNKLGKSFKFRI